MSGSNPHSGYALLRLLYNHNPLYVISALLVLYGLQISFPSEATESPGWDLLKPLGGYALLVTLAGVLVVRIGRAWEDARTVLLVLLLLVVAISSSFDRNCLDDTARAAKILGVGWAGAILLTELLPLLLGIRLLPRYRLPLHVGWALLFAYPVYLGHLSLTAQEVTMSWLVLLFPTFASLPLLALLPAIWQAGDGETPNGTPWVWPWFPAPVFAFLAAGFAVRSYGLSASFELANGYHGGFQPYFLIPLLLVGCALLREVAQVCRKRSLRVWATVLPLGLIVIALPGLPSNEAEHRFITMLLEHSCPPILATVSLLLAFYTYAWSRGERIAELGIMFTLLCAAFVHPVSLDLHSLRPTPNLWVTSSLGIWLIGTGIWHRSYVRLLAALVLATFAVCTAFGLTLATQQHLYISLNIGLVSLHGLSAVFDDRMARCVRRWSARHGPVCISGLAVFYPLCFTQLGLEWHFVAFVAILASVLSHWYFYPTLRRLLAVSTVVLWLSMYGTAVAGRLFYRHSDLRGAGFLIAGVVCLSAGLGVSLSKHGNAGRLVRKLVQITKHRATEPSGDGHLDWPPSR